MTTEKTATDIVDDNAPDDIETQLIEIRKKLKALLRNKRNINESRAKQLRKQWQVIEESLKDDEERQAIDKDFSILRDCIHEQVEKREKDYQAISDDIESLPGLIKKGELTTIQQLEQSIINRVNKIPGLSDQRRQTVIQQIDALKPKIAELSAWRHWGTVQAREKAIDEAKALDIKTMSPEKIAKRIKELRDTWQQWDKSGEGGDKKLYDTFDKACSAAYEPCKAYFAEKKKKREANGAQREALCEEVETLLQKEDWREPDWRQLHQFAKNTSASWRKIGPAEFRLRKTLDKRFQQAMAQLDEKLDRERQRNFKARTKLITDIEALSSIEDARDAVNKIQDLSKQWVVSVAGKRGAENKLWQRYKKACDGVYQRKRDEQTEFHNSLKSNLEARQALCLEIESVTLEEHSIDKLEAMQRDFRERWQESGKIHDKARQRISKRFQQAIRRLQDELNNREAREQQQSLQDISNAIMLVMSMEHAADATSTNNKENQVLLDAMAEPLRKRYDAAQNNITAAAKPKADNKLLDLQLQLELNCDVPSPNAYAKQRMQLKVARLAAAMGKGDGETKNNQQILDAMIACGPVSKACYDDWLLRFQNCCQRLMIVQSS